MSEEVKVEAANPMKELMERQMAEEEQYNMKH